MKKCILLMKQSLVFKNMVKQTSNDIDDQSLDQRNFFTFLTIYYNLRRMYSENFSRCMIWVCLFGKQEFQIMRDIKWIIQNNNWQHLPKFYKINTWSMLSQAPTVAAARGTGRLKIASSFSASVLISIMLFWTGMEWLVNIITFHKSSKWIIEHL